MHCILSKRIVNENYNLYSSVCRQFIVNAIFVSRSANNRAAAACVFLVGRRFAQLIIIIIRILRGVHGNVLLLLFVRFSLKTLRVHNKPAPGVPATHPTSVAFFFPFSLHVYTTARSNNHPPLFAPLAERCRRVL